MIRMLKILDLPLLLQHFSPAALTKRAIASLISDFLLPLTWLFVSAEPFSGSVLKKQPISSTFKLLTGSYHNLLWTPRVFPSMHLSVPPSTLPASRFALFSLMQYSIFHFHKHPLDAVKVKNSSFSNVFFFFNF